MESALDELLDAQMAADEASDDDSSTTPLCDDSEEYFEDEEDESELPSVDIQHRKRKSDEIDCHYNQRNQQARTTMHEDSRSLKHALEVDEIKVGEISPPLNFSAVNCKFHADRLKMEFPLYIDALKHELLVEINQGEMLYLPCGWFHEVTSRSKSLADNNDEHSCSFSPCHQAINYWFHPPDGMTFEHPYLDDFWRKNWEARNLCDDDR